uniref:Uncharacterized protein n=1 Tax=Fagus sylvatica TaxID=28930 RepID=A0A2N9IIL7_FAGSY
MLTTSSGELDLESQRTVLLKPKNSVRIRWRAILLIIQVRNRLRAYIADKGSLNRSVSSSTSYYSTIASLDDLEEADPQIVEIVEIISDSSQVSITVNLEGEDGENDDCSRDAKLQQANISKMVKEKDLDSIQMFGGVQVIAEALGTDLEKGITSFWLKPKTLPTTQTTALGFFQFLRKSCNNYTILLLLVSAVLSLGFGIKEEGLRTGWYEGVIIILAIVVLVFSDSIREYRLKHSHKMSGRQRPLGIQKMVRVIREGDLKEVLIYDVLLGDIVFLDKDYFVPADGLFISGGGGGGEFLKVDNDLESIINEENPFLFYGAQVIDGNGFMLVASVGMDTKWGDLMKQVIDAPDKTSLPAQLDKVNTGTQITGLIISIIILIVLFLRFMLRNKHVNPNHPDFNGELIGNKERMNAIVKIFMKPNGKIGKIITSTTSLATLLVGVMGGIPFVIALAISYWNKKILFVKAFAQEIFACLTMSSVTTICIDTTSLLNDPEADGREIQVLQNAGVNIILVSVENVSVLEPICAKCGLLSNSNRLVLKGEDFRKYTPEEKMDNADKIVLIDGLLPDDKLILVQCLKKKGHLVAMVGVKINEIPALREANVGIAGTCSHKMVRESSDIIIMDGDFKSNFNSLITIVRCGRCTYDNIQKYIQLVLTMNIAGLLITSITTMVCGSSPITTVQLLWTNYLVTLFGGLGLLTEPATEKLMERPPFRQSEPLITKAMWRNLVIQALYQAAIIVSFQFKGQTILDVSEEVNQTIIFNSFVLCQVFNLVNAREVEKKNVFKGIHQNPLFWVSVGVFLALQMAFTETTHILARVPRLNCVQWNHSYDTLYSSTPSDFTSNLEMPLTKDGTRI